MEVLEYDQRILRKLQLKELDIFKDFIKICDKYKLPYFATGGTAIGALRHNGFIPWDDDIDVCMLRKDYERFMEVAACEMGEKYIFMNTDNEPKYPLMFGKMILKGTKFTEQANAEADYPLGIFIDIFPYDKTPQDCKERRRMRKKTWKWGRIHVLALTSNPLLPNEVQGAKRRMAKFGCSFLHKFLRLIGITPDYTAKNYLKWAKKYENTDSKLYIDYSYINSEQLLLHENDIYPLAILPFEDINIALVREYDKFLRPEYGEYMELPPIEKQHNHYAKYIDFGDEIYEYIVHD